VSAPLPLLFLVVLAGCESLPSNAGAASVDRAALVGKWRVQGWYPNPTWTLLADGEAIRQPPDLDDEDLFNWSIEGGVLTITSEGDTSEDDGRLASADLGYRRSTGVRCTRSNAR
jgi:hypothetical protein